MFRDICFLGNVISHKQDCNRYHAYIRGQGRAHLHQKLLIRLKGLDTGWISHIQPFEEGVLPVIPQLSHEAATESKGLDDILQRMIIIITWSLEIVFKSSSLSWIMARCTSMASDYWINIVIRQHVHTIHHIQKTRTRLWHPRSCQNRTATQSSNAAMKMRNQQPSTAKEGRTLQLDIRQRTHALQHCKARVEHLYPLKMLMPLLKIAPMNL